MLYYYDLPDHGDILGNGQVGMVRRQQIIVTMGTPQQTMSAMGVVQRMSATPKRERMQTVTAVIVAMLPVRLTKNVSAMLEMTMMIRPNAAGRARRMIAYKHGAVSNSRFSRDPSPIPIHSFRVLHSVLCSYAQDAK